MRRDRLTVLHWLAGAMVFWCIVVLVCSGCENGQPEDPVCLASKWCYKIPGGWIVGRGEGRIYVPDPETWRGCWQPSVDALPGEIYWDPSEVVQ